MAQPRKVVVRLPPQLGELGYTPAFAATKGLPMSDLVPDPLLAFVEHIERQLAKHGYPEQRVSFPIERMYESAAAKELSFNKVLEVLAERGIAHEKTPEKIIFLPSTEAQTVPDLGTFAGFDPSMLAGLSTEQLLAAAQTAMQKMSPEQLTAMRGMIEGMTPEQQAEMIEQARKLGLV